MFLGFHSKCGGKVYTSLSNKGKNIYYKCNRCAISGIHIDDILTESDMPEIIHQNTRGIKRRPKKYDAVTWQELLKLIK
jgi:hypothetical protein